jgi:hypothetical protein
MNDDTRIVIGAVGDVTIAFLPLDPAASRYSREAQHDALRRFHR